MPYMVLIKCDDESTSWQRASSSVESQCSRGLANTNEPTMTERFAMSKWLASGLGLASDDSSDRWVSFTMNGSQEMGNVCAHHTTSSSQSSVSKKTPETNDSSKNFSRSRHRNTKCLRRIFNFYFKNISNNLQFAVHMFGWIAEW